MLYETAREWLQAERKRLLLFGMSGAGKTRIGTMLRNSGNWFHYNIDYRIGTRYMGEFIADNAKAEAMKVPFLRDLLLSDSIYIGSNLTCDDLSPVSSYLGKPGSTGNGGLPMAEYMRRQAQFRRSEISALLDTEYFIDRSRRLYRYPHFVCDTGGSVCEWVNPHDPEDPVLTKLSQHTLMVWVQSGERHMTDLIKRFDAEPKPMAYQPEFLSFIWNEYLAEHGCDETDVNPDSFIRWAYARALAHRQPRYAAIARAWGITVDADILGACHDECDIVNAIAEALDKWHTPETGPTPGDRLSEVN